MKYFKIITVFILLVLTLTFLLHAFFSPAVESSKRPDFVPGDKQDPRFFKNLDEKLTKEIKGEQ